jgi:hypothetical protein
MLFKWIFQPVNRNQQSDKLVYYNENTPAKRCYQDKEALIYRQGVLGLI